VYVGVISWSDCDDSENEFDGGAVSTCQNCRISNEKAFNFLLTFDVIQSFWELRDQKIA